jgi:uncharacterized protein YbaP (TraB family)
MSVRTGVAARILAGLSLFVAGQALAAAPTSPGPTPPATAGETRCPPQALAPTQDAAMEGMRDAGDNGVMWKATQGGRSVYLYGTIHVARMAWMFPGPQIRQALAASDTIALELDPTDPDIVARLRKAILRGPGTPALPEALERRLEAQMAAACVAPESLQAMRPEMQAVSLEVLEGRRSGLYPDFGIDGFLANMARGMKKPIRSLETPESQARLLVSDDPAETARTVGDMLEELEGGKGPDMLQRLAGDWQRGDLADLGAYASWCECLDTPQEKADFVKLVDDRNPPMADKIVKWHAEGRSLFVAVGTLHLIGPGGVPALLAARGFRVERVPFAQAP